MPRLCVGGGEIYLTDQLVNLSKADYKQVFYYCIINLVYVWVLLLWWGFVVCLVLFNFSPLLLPLYSVISAT